MTPEHVNNAKDIFVNAAGSLLAGAAATVGTTLLCTGPLQWFLNGRKLRLLLKDRRFELTYNPKNGGTKRLTFHSDGQIGEGRNINEFGWRVRRGKLELMSADGKVYSRFFHDKETGQLKHTNDADCPSVHGQFIVPFRVPPSS